MSELRKENEELKLRSTERSIVNIEEVIAKAIDMHWRKMMKEKPATSKRTRGIGKREIAGVMKGNENMQRMEKGKRKGRNSKIESEKAEVSTAKSGSESESEGASEYEECESKEIGEFMKEMSESVHQYVEKMPPEKMKEILKKHNISVPPSKSSDSKYLMAEISKLMETLPMSKLICLS